jgi:hypothetical protein
MRIPEFDESVDVRRQSDRLMRSKNPIGVKWRVSTLNIIFNTFGQNIGIRVCSQVSTLGNKLFYIELRCFAKSDFV